MAMRSSPAQLVLLVIAVAALSSCGSRSVTSETRLIEVHGDRAYVCLSDAINTSEPPSCGSDIGTRDNPELHGRMVPELVRVLSGTNQSVNITASEEDGRWFLQGFAAPE